MKVQPKYYGAAIHVQSAVNLSGVIFSFAEAMQAICDEAYETGKGTDWKNNHPICRLFAEQIAHLTRNKQYHVALKECEEATNVEEDE